MVWCRALVELHICPVKVAEVVLQSIDLGYCFGSSHTNDSVVYEQIVGISGGWSGAGHKLRILVEGGF
jgi:hypothetical protein